MIVVYFERRFGVGHEQGHLCSHSVTRSRTTMRVVSPAEILEPDHSRQVEDLVYGEHIVSMNDNGMQSDLTNPPAGRDRQEDCWCCVMAA